MDYCEEQFDFEHTDFLKIRQGIFKAVKELIGNTFQIVNIRHIQYQESYSFRKDDDFADIKIFFKAKGQISDVKDATNPVNSLGEQLLKVLQPLKGGRIDADNSLDINELDKLSSKFTAFVKKIKDNLKQHNINTELIEIDDYKFTLSFSKNLRNCVYIFHFNKYLQDLKVEVRDKLKEQDLKSIINSSIEERFNSNKDCKENIVSEDSKTDEEDPFAF